MTKNCVKKQNRKKFQRKLFFSAASFQQWETNTNVVYYHLKQICIGRFVCQNSKILLWLCSESGTVYVVKCMLWRFFLSQSRAEGMRHILVFLQRGLCHILLLL